MVKRVSKRVSEIVFLIAKQGKHLLSDRDLVSWIFSLTMFVLGELH